MHADHIIDLHLFSSPVRKYRKSYCNHPGDCVGVGVCVAQMLKFLVKVFISISLEDISESS